jgi:flagellar basal-body rod protein FlgB
MLNERPEVDMLSKLMFARTSMPDLEKSLDAYSLRERVISNNVANVDTPGYRAKEVSFEDQYKKYLNSMSLHGSTTADQHMPMGVDAINQIMPRVQPAKGTGNDNGINGVDIDHEMAELAKNNIRYEMSLNLMKKKLTNLRAAIVGRS